jgi:hypothetical protein
MDQKKIELAFFKDFALCCQKNMPIQWWPTGDLPTLAYCKSEKIWDLTTCWEKRIWSEKSSSKT